jgi:uncharacterized Zn finger protein (UPF0148 family)
MSGMKSINFGVMLRVGMRSIASIGLSCAIVAASAIGVFAISGGTAGATVVNGPCGQSGFPALKLNGKLYCPVTGVAKVKSTKETGEVRTTILLKAARLRSDGHTQILQNLDVNQCTSQSQGGVLTLGANFGIDVKTPFVNIVQAHGGADVSYAWTNDESIETCNSRRTIFPCDVEPNTAKTQLVVSREYEEEVQMSAKYNEMKVKTVKNGNFTQTFYTRGKEVELNVGTKQKAWIHDYFGAVCQLTSVLGKYKEGGQLPESFVKAIRRR